MAIKKELLDQLLAGRDPQDLFAKGGLVDDLKKALTERLLNAELDEDLVGDAGRVAGNHRNGSSKKTMLTGTSKVTLDIPQYRDGSFDPKLIARYQRRFPDFHDKVISMYAHGMSVREIRMHLEELLSYDFSRLPRQKGATARHAFYGGQWRGSDREKLGRLWRRAVVGSPSSSTSVLNGYPGSRPG